VTTRRTAIVNDARATRALAARSKRRPTRPRRRCSRAARTTRRSTSTTRARWTTPSGSSACKKDSYEVLETLTLVPGTDSPTWLQILSRELNDRITVVRTPRLGAVPRHARTTSSRDRHRLGPRARTPSASGGCPRRPRSTTGWPAPPAPPRPERRQGRRTDDRNPRSTRRAGRRRLPQRGRPGALPQDDGQAGGQLGRRDRPAERRDHDRRRRDGHEPRAPADRRGDWVNNTGGAQSRLPRFKLKLGATTLIDTNVMAEAWAEPAPLGWRIDALINEPRRAPTASGRTSC
jgi:hypothetical protein